MKRVAAVVILVLFLATGLLIGPVIRFVDNRLHPVPDAMHEGVYSCSAANGPLFGEGKDQPTITVLPGKVIETWLGDRATYELRGIEHIRHRRGTTTKDRDNDVFRIDVSSDTLPAGTTDNLYSPDGEPVGEYDGHGPARDVDRIDLTIKPGLALICLRYGD